MDLKVMLADEQDSALRGYFYKLAIEVLQEARKDLNLDRDLVNKSEIESWLDVSPQFLEDMMAQGLPYTLIGKKKYFFSKQEVRKWIINHHKK